MPYVIFIAAAGMESLKNLHDYGRYNGYSTRTLTVSRKRSSRTMCFFNVVKCINVSFRFIFFVVFFSSIDRVQSDIVHVVPEHWNL